MEKYPQYIVGIDLSGDPTAGDIEEFLQLLEMSRKMGLKISVHCAEVNISFFLCVMNDVVNILNMYTGTKQYRDGSYIKI